MKIHISVASCETAVTPLLTHLSYCSLAPSHQYFLWRKCIWKSRLWCEWTFIHASRHTHSGQKRRPAFGWPHFQMLGENFVICLKFHWSFPLTTDLSWHVQIYDLISLLESKLKQEWFHKIWIMSSKMLCEMSLRGQWVRPWRQWLILLLIR